MTDSDAYRTLYFSNGLTYIIGEGFRLDGRGLTPEEWKREVRVRSDAATGARQQERIAQHFTCRDCGEGFDRMAPRAARKPTRCPPCAKTHALEYGRAYREAHKEDPR